MFSLHVLFGRLSLSYYSPVRFFLPFIRDPDTIPTSLYLRPSPVFFLNLALSSLGMGSCSCPPVVTWWPEEGVGVRVDCFDSLVCLLAGHSFVGLVIQSGGKKSYIRN